MPGFKKKEKRSPGYYGDTMTDIGEITAGQPVTISILPGRHCLSVRWGKEDREVPYQRITDIALDNESSIRGGVSRIPAELLEDVSVKSGDTFTRMEQFVRATTRWFCELNYDDENGDPQYLFIMERKSNGYYVDVLKSYQATQFEKYVKAMLSDSE